MQIQSQSLGMNPRSELIIYCFFKLLLIKAQFSYLYFLLIERQTNITVNYNGWMLIEVVCTCDMG